MTTLDPIYLVRTLHDIVATLEQGQTTVAANALRTLITELETHATDLDGQATPTVQPGPTTAKSIMRRRVAKLRRLLAVSPELREVAATTLDLRPDDIDAVEAGRLPLSPRHWHRLWLVLAERFLALD